jgi:hypothetical protein
VQRCRIIAPNPDRRTLSDATHVLLIAMGAPTVPERPQERAVTFMPGSGGVKRRARTRSGGIYKPRVGRRAQQIDDDPSPF